MLALAFSPFSCSYVYNHWGTMTTGLAKLNPGWRWDSKIKDQFAPTLSGAPSTELVDYAVKERSVEQPPITNPLTFLHVQYVQHVQYVCTRRPLTTLVDSTSIPVWWTAAEFRGAVHQGCQWSSGADMLYMLYILHMP